MKWRISASDADAAKALSEQLDVSPIVAQLLISRGHGESAAARKFLHPTLDDLHDPELLDGMSEAVKRVTRAVAHGEKILIYGDYDVDGMTSAALLSHFFKMLSANVTYFLPLRLSDGYGLNCDRLRAFKEDGINLIITADCGIGAHEEARVAKELGIDLIITDHHEPEGPLPDALAIVNPKKHGSLYPFRHLAGVGVAFKLAWAMAKAFSGQKKVSPEFREFLLNAVGLVALGTIADVAPLSGENRVFASFGLGVMSNTKLPGLRALMSVSGVTDSLTVRDVAYRLAPRLNAAGRLNEPLLGFELLTTESFGRALEIATLLDDKNRERQAIEKEILISARAQLLAAHPDPRGQRVIVLASADWHVGVIGIVASRIAEEYYRPAVLISIDGNIGKGSARSIPPFHMFNALKSCEGCLVDFGGHAQAAGVTVEVGKIDALREALCAYAAGMSREDLTPMMTVDAQVPLSSVTTALVRQLELLAPFGEANPQPLFASTGLSTAGRVRRVGADGQHLSFFVKSGTSSARAIAFGQGDLADRLEMHPGGISVAFEPQIDTFNGGGEAQLVVRDIRFD